MGLEQSSFVLRAAWLDWEWLTPAEVPLFLRLSGLTLLAPPVLVLPTGTALVTRSRVLLGVLLVSPLMLLPSLTHCDDAWQDTAVRLLLSFTHCEDAWQDTAVRLLLSLTHCDDAWQDTALTSFPPPSSAPAETAELVPNVHELERAGWCELVTPGDEIQIHYYFSKFYIVNFRHLVKITALA